MKNLSIFLLALATLTFFMSAGCKKKGPPIAPEIESPTLPTVPKSPDQESKTVVPLSLISDRIKIEFKYTANGKHISEIKHSDGTRETIDYNDKSQPKEYKRFSKDELVYKVSYAINQQDLVTKGIQFKVESGGKVLTSLGRYEIIYNDIQLISEIKWFNFKNILTASRQYSYNDKQYLTSIKTTDGTPLNLNYTYDDKLGLFKNATYTQLISIENESFYLLNNKSNVSSIENNDHAVENFKVVSQYNSDNYPSTITITDSGNQNKVYKVTYR